MPSGPAHLHERFGDDATAWEYLAERDWHHDRGRFFYAGDERELTQDERDAAAYLVLEWDWEWSPSHPLGPIGGGR